MKLSEFIIQYRKDHNLSARKFATMCGLSNAYISLIENESTKSPTLDALKKIANAIGMDVDEFIKLIDDETVISVKAAKKESEEPELIVINRAMKKMSPEKKEDMMNLLRKNFKEEFNDN